MKDSNTVWRQYWKLAAWVLSSVSRWQEVTSCLLHWHYASCSVFMQHANTLQYIARVEICHCGNYIELLTSHVNSERYLRDCDSCMQQRTGVTDSSACSHGHSVSRQRKIKDLNDYWFRLSAIICLWEWKCAGVRTVSVTAAKLLVFFSCSI